MSNLRTMTRAAAAALTLAVSAGTAHSAVYVGTFDPAFDPDNFFFGAEGVWFNNMGWRGSLQVNASLGCGTVGTVPIGGGCSATLESVRLELYQVGDAGQPTLASVNFTGLDLVPITALRFENGLLSQIASGVIGAQLATVEAIGQVPGFNPDFADIFSWALRFVIDYEGELADLFLGDEPPGEEARAAMRGIGINGGTPQLYNGAALAYFADEAFGTNLRSLPPTLSFTEVPLPGTLALGLAALAVMAGLQRRRGTRRR